MNNLVIEKKAKKDFVKILKPYITNYQLLLMVLPGLIVFIMFNYMPMLGVQIAFKDYYFNKGIWGSEWVGLEHFRRLFASGDFSRVFKNTLVICSLKILFGTPAPILFALLLNEVRHKTYKSFVQTCTYLPHFFSWVVLGGIITMLFSTSGPINTMLGAERHLDFFGSGPLFIALIIITGIWQNVGWNSVIYIAAIAGIDEALYEAAHLDGAGKLKKVFYITLPSIAPTIATVFILNMSNILNAGFDQIYNLYNTTVYDVADIIDTYVLRKLGTMEYEIGTAIGLLKSVVSLIFVLSANALVRKLDSDSYGIL